MAKKIAVALGVAALGFAGYKMKDSRFGKKIAFGIRRKTSSAGH